MRPMRLVGGFLIGLVLAACVAIPVSSSPPPLAGSAPPSARPSHATPPPPILTPVPATATPEPSIPADLSRSAVVEQGGVRLTIELERNPMPVAQPTWVRTTIKNTGHDSVIYYPCGEAVEVSGHVADAPWRSGRELPEPALTWKTDLLEELLLDERVREVLFLPVGQDGSASGCGDVAHVATVAPGAMLRERSRWDGLSFRRLVPPPTAPVDLVASFTFDRGDPEIEHPPEDRHFLEAHLETWIAGLPEPLLDPAEAVDVALTDPRLTAVLASHDLRNGNAGLVRFDPATGAFQIGLIEENIPSPRAHFVLVDARTGRNVGFVERDWDYDVDGLP